MKKTIIPTVLACLLAGCALGPPPQPGEPMAAVESRLGQPTARYAVGGDTLHEYGTGWFGQFAWMARYGANGRLLSYEQVRTDARFATLRLGVDDRETVLHTLGTPSETSYLALRDMEVWSYRYLQSGVWDAMMHVHFSRDGKVRELGSGPDLQRERRD